RAGVGQVLHRTRTAAASKEVSKKPGQSAEFRLLHSKLMDLSLAEVRELAARAGVHAPTKASKQSLIIRLMSEEHVEKIQDVVSPEQMAPPAISPGTLQQIHLHLETKAAGTLPQGVGRRSPQQHQAEDIEKATSDSPLQICDVRAPLQKQAKRQGLAELEVGARLTGKVVEVSLLDGLRVDIGAEADALVPVPMEDQALRAEVAEQHPLGSQLEVQIEDVSEDSARRFPVICSLPRSSVQLPDWKAVDMALRPSRDASTQGLRGQEVVELEAVDDWQPGEVELQRQHDRDQEVPDVPERPPPQVVMTIGPQELQAVQVPEQLRFEASEASAETRAAWATFMALEVEDARLQRRGRRRLCADLALAERRLLQRLAPPRPVELLGMVKLPDGRSCMLPVVDGDCLKFSSRHFDTPEGMEEWIQDCHKRHKAEWSMYRPEVEEPASRQLARFFACADVCHARAVEAAEKEEAVRLFEDSDDFDPDALEDDIARMISATPELEVQETLAERYFAKQKA
ncbi:unnamed protein product, partial [Effrenium voratum]